MVTSCKTIDKRVAPFTLFYCIHYQKTHRDTFRALSFLNSCVLLPSLYSLYIEYIPIRFPRRSDEASVHSISSSSSWIGRWLSRDISCDINKALIFYLNALREKNIHDTSMAGLHLTIVYKIYGYTMYVYHLYQIPVADNDQYRGKLYGWYICIYSCLLETPGLHGDMLADK